jgi:hypothetical protein
MLGITPMRPQWNNTMPVLSAFREIHERSPVFTAFRVPVQGSIQISAAHSGSGAGARCTHASSAPRVQGRCNNKLLVEGVGRIRWSLNSEA